MPSRTYTAIGQALPCYALKRAIPFVVVQEVGCANSGQTRNFGPEPSTVVLTSRLAAPKARLGIKAYYNSGI